MDQKFNPAEAETQKNYSFASILPFTALMLLSSQSA
jgi:hypothetical protein